MKIFTVEYIPKHSDDMVLGDEKSVSLSIDIAMQCVDIISNGNNTGRIFIEVWEDGKLIGSDFFPIALSYSRAENYLKGFTS